MNIQTTQQAVLSRLEKYFTEKLIAARLMDDDTRLTVLLTDLVPNMEIYGDIYFQQTGEDAGFGLLTMEFELMDASILEQDPALDLMIGASMLNAAIPLGGFGLRTNEDGNELRELVYRQITPLDAALSEDQSYSAAETAFFAMAAVMKNAAPDLIALAKGEITQEEFLEKL